MARERTLKAKFFRSQSIGELPFDGRLLFQCMWCHADRNGTLKYSPKLLKADAFPFDDITCDDVCNLVERMVEQHLVYMYTVDGVEYVKIVGFKKYQKPHPKEPQMWPFIDDSGNIVHQQELEQVEPVKKPAKPRQKPGSAVSNSALPSFPSSPSLPCSPTLRKEAPNGGAGFDAFWALYPKKVSKGAAEKAWGKLHPPVEQVLSALDWQRKQPSWVKDNGQFIPNPATYLNAKGWEDEPITSTEKTELERIREMHATGRL